MVRNVDISETPIDLAELLKTVEAGDDVVIVRDGQPVAKVTGVPVEEKFEREFDLFKGQVWIADDFDDPLPEMEPYM